ncbi:MAG: hypothetical protein JSV91_13710 [Phycisphaerales bacterium]|nr:MAG: hypothetical protein JSV91_13710 [Phycisphaerales bacterium]
MRTVHLLFGVLIWLAAAFGATPAAGDDVDVRLDTFGVGSYFRPGEFTAIRLGLTSNLDEPTAVWVQWDLPNADGDTAEYGRSLTLTPGRESLVWLYATVPPKAETGSVWQVRVFEERDGNPGGDLGGSIISPADANSQSIEQTSGMIGLIGNSDMKLDSLGASSAGPEVRPPGAHENTRLVRGISPRDLPDRWEGLRGFEAIAWGDARRNRPEDITTDQARALTEYVRRGGHLIISLPSAGNPWQLGTPGKLEPDLERLLPTLAPRRAEDVPVNTLLPVLSKADRTAGNPMFAIRVFKDLDGEFDAIDNHYEPLIALPGGRVVVIQRTYGFGRITLVGIDLSSGTLRALALPEGDVFWNRILGRRADTPTSSTISQLQAANRIPTSGRPAETSLGGDKLITDQINMSQSAAAGLLLALLLFALYWVIAGPGGFAVLKQYRQTKHAWLAFAATAAVFTTVAWLAVGLLRPRSVAVRHVTFLDYLARPDGDRGENDPQYQRAASFFSLYLPSYVDTEVALDSEEGQRDLLATWAPPLAFPQPFPNVDRYRIDVGRSPASYRVPARATATQMYAHWFGGLSRDWGGMLFSDPEDPIRVVMQGDRESLAGRVIHDLPGTLEDITIIWVGNQRLLMRRHETGRDALPVVEYTQRGRMLNIGRTFGLRNLEPGTPLDLGPLDYTGRSSILDENIRIKYVDPYADKYYGATTGSLSAQDERNYMEMLGIFQQLTPPEYFLQRGQENPRGSISARRYLGRELDLSAWFSRPCLIIIGYLRDSDLPIPLTVNGEPPRTTDSLTVVRWIYPLPLNEDIAFRKPEGG